MKKEVLIATNNIGKLKDISELLNLHGIKTASPKELGIDIDPEESGSSLEENSELKALAFQKYAPDRLVLADDRGLEIDALHNEPGIYVRRWKDKKTHMTDEEIINYCLERMAGIPKEKRSARFRAIATLAIPGVGIETFEGAVQGEILEKPESFRAKGLPFDCLFYVTATKLILGKSSESHWRRAIVKAIPRVKELLKTL